jgi:hypothetical protein
MARVSRTTDKAANDMARKDEKAKAKAEARAERNREQAIEESKAWEATKGEAKALVETYQAKRGRPSVMTDSVQQEILDRLTGGQSLSAICAMDHMPSPTAVYEFMQKSPVFAENYTRACGGLATLLFNQCLDIADDASRDMIVDEHGNLTPNHAAIARDKLRIETRFRMAGKLSGKYADKPLIGDGATVNMQSLTVNARDMDPTDRDRLRALLLEARDKAQGQVIDG